jgi:hypothetical protein
VGGGFTLQSNSHLVSVDLPQLTHVGGKLYVYGAANVTSMSFPMVQTVQFVDIDYCNSMTSLSFNSLTAVTSFIVEENAALTSVSAPVLTTTTNYFEVFNNPQLPTCKVLALLAQISPAPGYGWNTSGNSSSCPP